MSPLAIVVTTLFSYWLIGFIVYELTNENDYFAAWWATGLVAVALWLLLAPYRVIKKARNTHYDKT